MMTTAIRSRCPRMKVLERGGPEVEAHLAECPACRSIVELMRASAVEAAPPDCARAELLIAAGGSSPLGAEDAAFLPAHLSRCPSCREIALEPPAGENRELPRVAPDHYVLGAEIGRGGMGRVLSARDQRIGRAVALKEMLATDDQARARFEREARITAQLQHPGIVSIYEVGRWPDGRPFYAMPILPGRTLREAIAGARTVTERLRLVPTLIAAADAVAYAHSRRIIHRDLTPSNILLGSFGETIVIDWGVAKDLEEEAPPVASNNTQELPPPSGPGQSSDYVLTAMGTVIGTPAYISPEQADGRGVDERTDVYALGAILYQVLTGRPPYDGTSAATVIEKLRARTPPPIASGPGVPTDLRSIAGKAMAGDPAQRYPNAGELALDLRHWQAGEQVQAHAYTRGELTRRWLARRMALVVTASVMLALVGATAIAGGLKVARERKRAEATDVELQKIRQQLGAANPTPGGRRGAQPVPGWFAAGSNPGDYDMGVDRALTWQGQPTVRVKSLRNSTSGFGTLMQMFSADAYRGKRVRLSAHVKGEQVKGWAGLWMRVDSKGKRPESIAFDNMQSRAVKGTADWKRYDVVLDVEEDAGKIALGLLLAETGTVWMGGVTVEVVDRSVPSTDITTSDVLPAPRNLDFVERASGKDKLPPGWRPWGDRPDSYEVGVDHQTLWQGRPAGYVSLRAGESEGGFGTLMQSVQAAGFKKNRVRFSAAVRTRDVSDTAGLWMRVDGRGDHLAFDNMRDRPIKGTTDWRRYEVVLDVDEEARAVAFGVLLAGSGAAYIADARLESVDKSVPTTPAEQRAPQNLDFRQ